MTFETYRLPSGEIVRIDSELARGAAVIDFTLKGGSIVQAARVETVLVRIRSHRARHALERALGRLPQGYYTYTQPGEWREIAVDEWPKVKGLTGVTRARVERTMLRPYLY